MGAGRNAEAEEIAADLRWVAARLRESGPAAPATDLSLTGSTRETRLTAALARTAHLLAPTEPARSRDGCPVAAGSPGPGLGSSSECPAKLRPNPGWSTAGRYRTCPSGTASCPEATAGSAPLRSRRTAAGWPQAARRDGADLGCGHRAAEGCIYRPPHAVIAVAAAPDGSWLATGGGDRTVRIWDAETWKERAILTGHIIRDRHSGRAGWQLAGHRQLGPEGSVSGIQPQVRNEQVFSQASPGR